MKSMMSVLFFVAASAALSLSSSLSAFAETATSDSAVKQGGKSPIKVFILAGQSNMAGADSEVAVPPGFQQTAADRATRFTMSPLPDDETSKQYVPWGEIRGHQSKNKQRA